MKLTVPRGAGARLRGAAAPLLACLALALSLFDLSAALPRDRHDYLVTLDITQSMNTRDYQLDGSPASRLAYAKHALAEALRGLPCGSRLGWSVFTEHRVLVLLTPVEVCAHYGELADALARIDARMAWAGASEVSKGLFRLLDAAQAISPRPAVVFVTDGHEAPPLHPRLRPRFDGRVGAVHGLIVGVGGERPLPIPKLDPEGRPLGYWQADEVAQTDAYSSGRPGSRPGEAMVDADGPVAPAPERGGEHLSSLREAHLRELAAHTGLGFHRLESARGLAAALAQPQLARRARVRTDLRFVPAAFALLLLAAPQLRRRVNSRT